MPTTLYRPTCYAPIAYVPKRYEARVLAAVSGDELPPEDDYCSDCGKVHAHSPAGEGWVRPPRGIEVVELKTAVLDVFRRHHAYALVYYGLALKSATKVVNLGAAPIDLSQFWATDARTVYPALEMHYDRAGQRVMSRIGASNTTPWNITNPYTQQAIQEHSIVLCRATAATTSFQLNRAVELLKREIASGALPTGFGPRELAKRVGKIFTHAERYRADRIAITEAGMANEDGGTLAGAQSGVIAGYRPSISPDACEICVAAVARWPVVSMKDALAGLGQYGGMKGSVRKLPLYHPNCMCTKVAILDTEAEQYGLAPHKPEQGQGPEPIAPQALPLAPEPVSPVTPPLYAPAQMPPTPVTPAQSLTANLRKAEAEIRRASTETMFAWDSNGKPLFKIHGEHNRVRIPDEQISKLKGSTHLHNHPRGQSFSPDDVSLAIRTQTKQMVVISDKFRYVMEVPQTTEGAKLAQDVIAYAKKTEKGVYAKFRPLVSSNQMTADMAVQEHWHTIWSKAAKRFKDQGLKYTRIKL